MSILVQVLLTFLMLSAFLGDVVTPWTHTLETNMLKESIRLLDDVQQEVSCNRMNVTNIFADYKRGNNRDILCKAATIARESQSCHRNLEGIYLNLLGLVRSREGYKKQCPVAAGSTIPLKNFLKELHQVLQEEYKNQK